MKIKLTDENRLPPNFTLPSLDGLSSHRTTIQSEGKTYQLLGKSTETFSFGPRAWLTVRTLAITFFTIGLALLAETIRDDWKTIWNGKRDVLVYSTATLKADATTKNKETPTTVTTNTTTTANTTEVATPILSPSPIQSEPRIEPEPEATPEPQVQRSTVDIPPPKVPYSIPEPIAETAPPEMEYYEIPDYIPSDDDIPPPVEEPEPEPNPLKKPFKYTPPTLPPPPPPVEKTGEQIIAALKKDPFDKEADFKIAEIYHYGKHGIPVSLEKALDHYHTAGVINKSVQAWNRYGDLLRTSPEARAIKKQTEKEAYATIAHAYTQAEEYGRDAHAQYWLGEFCRLGLGYTSQSFPRAIEYYLKAREKNHIPSINRLGEMHEKGQGIAKPDPEEALKFYAISANLEDPDGLYHAGRLLLNKVADLEKKIEATVHNQARSPASAASMEESLKSDRYFRDSYLERALKTLTQATNAGHLEASLLLADLLRTNPPTRTLKNFTPQTGYDKAKAIYEGIEAKEHHPHACYGLGEMHRNGQGVVQSSPEAIRYYEKANSTKPFIPANNALGDLYSGADPNRALGYYGKSAESGDRYAQYHYGKLAYELSKQAFNENQKMPLLRNAKLTLEAAASKNCPEAIFLLGYLYRTEFRMWSIDNISEEQGKGKALNWWEKGIELKDPLLMFHYVMLYASGEKIAGIEHLTKERKEYGKIADNLRWYYPIELKSLLEEYDQQIMDNPPPALNGRASMKEQISYYEMRSKFGEKDAQLEAGKLMMDYACREWYSQYSDARDGLLDGYMHVFGLAREGSEEAILYLAEEYLRDREYLRVYNDCKEMPKARKKVYDLYLDGLKQKSHMCAFRLGFYSDYKEPIDDVVPSATEALKYFKMAKEWGSTEEVLDKKIAELTEKIGPSEK